MLAIFALALLTRFWDLGAEPGAVQTAKPSFAGLGSLVSDTGPPRPMAVPVEVTAAPVVVTVAPVAAVQVPAARVSRPKSGVHGL